MPTTKQGWIGVDFDGTLAQYSGWEGPLTFGAPVRTMVERVQRWLEEGYEVRVVTARAFGTDGRPNPEVMFALDTWIMEHIGQLLPITCSKDFDMIELWDDRCVQVIQNTGAPVSGQISRLDGVQ